jgi:hypothetical protein
VAGLPDSTAAQKLVEWIVDKATDGVPPLSPAEDLAQEYMLDKSYASNDDRVAALINWETAKNFTSGFITGLGGIITLPVAVPGALGASWVIQGRMCGAIAKIYGHKLKSDRVRTLVICSLIGNEVKEILKSVGVQVGRNVAKKAIGRISGKVLIEINKRVGFRLLTKAGERGVVNLTKAVPFVGGIVGGVFDAATCRVVGATAKSIFAPSEPREP